MKLSLAWIFDHIKELYRAPHATRFDPEFVQRIVTRLGEHTTEIESVVKIELPVERLAFVQFQQQEHEQALFVHAETKKQLVLPLRSGLVAGGYYLVIQEDKQYRYATLADLSSEKEGLVPEVRMNAAEAAGSWRASAEVVDYLITIDNKAITHRPDLWGHRGFAREIAALLGMTLRLEEDLVKSVPIRHYEQYCTSTPENPYALRIDGLFCKRIAAVALHHTAVTPSKFFMTYRLARVDSRPYNAFVDSTNYVMFDLGQPMHAFDAATLDGNELVARKAFSGESLTLLDGQTVTLSSEDGIIADKSQARALAGVMGGKNSGVSLATKTVLLESANFDPDMIRKTAMRYRKRTDASARFEKGLDPHQNTTALLRALQLLDEQAVVYTLQGGIASLGTLAAERTVQITHDYIVHRIGMHVTGAQITNSLTKLGFGVVVRAVGATQRYDVSVPTFRLADIVNKESLLEEIVRMIGYQHITRQLPTRLCRPVDHTAVLTTRAIKRHAAFAWHAHEVHNYAFYDETWLRRIAYEPQAALRVKNPVSEHWQRLVTSLVPHLLKNVAHNVPEYETVNLFEVNKVWQLVGDTIQENKQLAGVYFSYKRPYDFYAGKAQLQSLFDLLSLLVVWQKPQSPIAPWYLPEKSAELVADGVVIGYAGMAAPRMVHEVAEGEAFIFELSMDALVQYKPAAHRYEPVSKYQQVSFDMSLLVPRAVTVDALKEAVATVDARIIQVVLRDFFENQQWPDQRSVTLRYTVVDQEKTLTKEDIDAVWHAATTAVARLGAQVR